MRSTTTYIFDSLVSGLLLEGGILGSQFSNDVVVAVHFLLVAFGGAGAQAGSGVFAAG